MKLKSKGSLPVIINNQDITPLALPLVILSPAKAIPVEGLA